jgi:hypothetical protein
MVLVVSPGDILTACAAQDGRRVPSHLILDRRNAFDCRYCTTLCKFTGTFWGSVLPVYCTTPYEWL